MRAFTWLASAGAGFALMAWSYFGRQMIDPPLPWLYGRLYVAVPGAAIDKQLPEAPNQQPADFDVTRVQVRLLPADRLVETISERVTSRDVTTKASLEVQFHEKLFRLSPSDVGIDERLLAEGRMPVPGRREVLAGCETQYKVKKQLMVAGETLTVVGVLPRGVALFSHSYFIPADGSLAERLFDPRDPAVHEGILIRLTREQAGDPEVARRLESAFPRQQFAGLGPSIRTEPGPFRLYMAGLVMMLLGGSGCLINIYAILSRRIRWSPLREPLELLTRRSRLLWGLHLVYFGLVSVAALNIYNLPTLQTLFVGLVHAELTSGQSVAESAVRAYSSGSIPGAALATLLINYFAGSLGVITVPSFILPGVGVLTAAIRAVTWGLLLAPTTGELSLAMLPHSWTMLLEGEGYILAAFFAALVPIYLYGTSMAGGGIARYRQAVIANLKGNLLVVLVLAVAACYEATEVILMNR